jgi:putative flippase GtrA
MKQLADRQTRQELIRYLFGGFSAVGADCLTYRLLLPSVGADFAKACSFVAGTIVAYLLQKFLTFKRNDHSWTEMAKFSSLYGVSLCINMAVNHLVIYICVASGPQLAAVKFPLGWLFATGTSTIFNYIGQKFWVFKKKQIDNEEPQCQ